jgi:hypothetical protein
MEPSSSWEDNRHFSSQEIFQHILKPRRFITVFARACHLPLSWASYVQSLPPYTISTKVVLILYFHLRLCHPSGSFRLAFPPKACIHSFTLCPMRDTCPAHLILPDLIIPIVPVEKLKQWSSSVWLFSGFLLFHVSWVNMVSVSCIDGDVKVWSVVLKNSSVA